MRRASHEEREAALRTRLERGTRELDRLTLDVKAKTTKLQVSVRTMSMYDELQVRVRTMSMHDELQVRVRTTCMSMYDELQTCVGTVWT